MTVRGKAPKTAAKGRDRAVKLNAQTGAIEIRLHPDMPEPTVSFYADELHVVPVEYGQKLLAVQRHPTAGGVVDAVQVVFDRDSFARFRDLVNSIKDILRLNAPEGFRHSPLPASPFPITATYPASAAHVATSYNGVTMDFYHLAPMAIYKIQLGIHDAEMRPVVRLHLLAGRCHVLLDPPSEP